STRHSRSSRRWSRRGTASPKVPTTSSSRGDLVTGRLAVTRRTFLRAFGVSLSVASRAAAQPAASPRRIGFLLVGLTPESKAARHFRYGLRDAGWSEGRDVLIEWRSAKGEYERVEGLVNDFIQQKVDVIVVDSTVAAQVLKRSTSTVPIV